MQNVIGIVNKKLYQKEEKNIKIDKDERINEVNQNLEVMLQTIKISNNKEAVEEWISDFEDYIGYVKTYLFIELFDNE